VGFIIVYSLKLINFGNINNMETNSNEQITSPVASTINTCPSCHQPIISTYYFCPNCGIKLNQAPLSTDTLTQVKIYAFSIILPMICFLFITKWPGIKYYKSEDPKTKQIGEIAWILLVLSTIITIYLAFVWTQKSLDTYLYSIDPGTYGL